MENIFTLKVKDAVAKGQALADDIWLYKHPGEPIQAEDSEYLSWVNSTPRFLKVAMDAGLGELDAIFEMPTPDGGYVDVVLAGSNAGNATENRLMLVELKQWSSFEAIDDQAYVGIHVESNISKRKHPVAQLLNYRDSLRENHRGFYHAPEIKMEALAYLHDFVQPWQLFSGIYNVWKTAGIGIYVKNDEEKMQARLKEYFFGCTASDDLLKIIDDCGYVMGVAGFEGLKSVMERKENASMVMDQQPVVDEVIEHMKRQAEHPHPEIIVVSGGPGTGKTIVGMHFIYDYASLFPEADVAEKACFCLPRSRTVKAMIEYACEKKLRVPYFGGADGEHDLMVIDEAHRMNEKDIWSLDNVFASGTKMVILLQDDHQLIHPEERGILRYFLRYAQKRKIPFTSLHLTIQKRCTELGSLLTGLEKLFYQEHANELIRLSSVKVFDRLCDMDAWIQEKSKTSRAKILAPYCWPWGGKNDDVTIPRENFQKRWNPGNTDQQAEALSNFTSTDAVYCIYTSQGLDLDNIAFIWWDDLRWDETKGSWVISLKENQDPRFQKAVREANLTENTPWLILLFKDMYYVMLSRARENLGIWFRDAATKKHVCEVLGLTPEN